MPPTGRLALQAGGYVNPIAEDIVTFGKDVPEVCANALLNRLQVGP